MSITGVVLVHILMLYIFWIKPFRPEAEPELRPLESIVYLSPSDKNTPAPPEALDKEQPTGNGSPLSAVPPPVVINPPRLPTQQEMDTETLTGFGRSMACMAGQFEHLTESARKLCSRVIVPWQFDRGDVLARQFKPTDPNTNVAPVSGADTNRQILGTTDPCVGLAGPAADSCRRMNPGGLPSGGGLGVRF